MAKKRSRKQTPEELAQEEFWARRVRERIAERLEIEGEFEAAAREREILRQRWGPAPGEAGEQATA